MLNPSIVMTDKHKQWVDNHGQLIDYKILLQFKNYPMSVILRSILPSSIEEIQSTFEMVGHIAHFNLKEEMLPYKSIIGELTVS